MKVRNATEKFPDLSGDRIDLVQLDSSAIDDLDEYSRMPEFFDYLEFPPYTSRAESEEYFEKLVMRSDPSTGHYWMIRLKGDNKIIGTVGVVGIDWRTGSGELGYGISPLYWGQGYFKEALRLAIGHLFKEKGFHRLWAKTQWNNTASIKGLESLGFTIEGKLRDFYLSMKDDCRHDAMMMSLLRPEFKDN